MSRVGSTVLLLTLALLALAGVPLLGRAALVPAGLFLLLAALRALRPAERGWGGWGAVIAGLVGGSIGVAGARAGFGWAALIDAALALGGGALARARPRAAVGLLLAGSTAGSLAMGLFTLNTWFFAMLPVCWLGAALAAFSPRPPAGSAGRLRGERP